MASLAEAVAALKRGEIVAYPTESFWALGADATNPSAIRKLFRAKRRERNKPIALIAADIEQVRNNFSLTPVEVDMMKLYWPRSLTLILTPKRKIVADLLGARRIGVRVPPHARARALAKAFGGPITATSANISGGTPTKSSGTVGRHFPGIMRLSGECGNFKEPSTVVELLGRRTNIIRPGALKI